MLRRTLAVVSLAVFVSSAAAQIPEAPGTAGVAPRDEEPDRARPVVPPDAPLTMSADDAGEPPEPSASEIVNTMDEAKAAAEAKPKVKRGGKRRRAPHRAPTPAP